MNKITIILDGAKNAGNVDEIKKDFNIYQKSKQSILLNVLVPKSLIGGEVSKQYFDSNGMMVTESGTYTALKMGMVSIDDYGKLTKTQSYYLRYLKEIKTQNGEFYLYERMLPNEFTLVAGVGFNAPKLVFNVVNILNNISFDEQGKTIVNDPTIVSLITTQMCRLDILPSTNLDQDQPVQATELELLNAEVDMLIQKIGNKVGVDNAVLKYNLNEDLPVNIIFNKDGYKTAGVLFSNAVFEIPNLDYKTETKTGSIIVTNVRNGNGKTLQTEAFFYDDAVSQRVLELDEKFAVSSVGEWSVKVDRKQSKEHVGEFLYVDKKGNINFTKALKDFITKSNDEVISEDTSSYEFSEDFKAVAKNKEEIRIELSDEAKNLLSNANSLASELAVSIDPDTYIMKVALLNTKGDEISSEIVDLPLESMIIDGRYENGYIYLQLQSGTEINFSIASLISGLVPTTRKINGRTLDKDIEIPIPTKLSELSEKDYNSLDNLPIIPEGVEVIDNLESTRKDASASANMARVLNENKQNKLIAGNNITISADGCASVDGDNYLSYSDNLVQSKAILGGKSGKTILYRSIPDMLPTDIIHITVSDNYLWQIFVWENTNTIYRCKIGSSEWTPAYFINGENGQKFKNIIAKGKTILAFWDNASNIEVYRSLDEGNNWNLIATLNKTSVLNPFTGDANVFGFCTGGPSSKWIVTTDNGESWTTNDWFSTNIGQIHFINNMYVAFIDAGLPKMYYSKTLSNFIEVDTSELSLNSSMLAYDIYPFIFVKNNQLYLAAAQNYNSSKVWRTNDTFSSFTEVYSFPTYLYRGVILPTGIAFIMQLNKSSQKIYKLILDYMDNGVGFENMEEYVFSSETNTAYHLNILIIGANNYIYEICHDNSSIISVIGGINGLNNTTDQLQNDINKLNNRFYSLDNASSIPKNADLNEYKQSGNYACKTGDETISTIKNKPSEVTSVFTMKVYSSNGGASGSYPIQEITTFNLQRYIRRFNNDSNNGSGAWTEWYKIMTDKEINSKYYSVGPSQIIPANADLNNYTLPGNYAVNNADVVQTIKNKPTDVVQIFYLRNTSINGSTNGNYISQELTSFTQQKYVRTYNGDVSATGVVYGWTEWKRIITSDGGYISGQLELNGVKIKGYKKAGASTPANTIFIATPTYNVLSPSTATDEYFQQLLGWICKNYPNMKNCLFVGQAQPNSTGLFQIQIYDTSNTQSTIINGKHLDLPRYSSGFYVGLGGVFRIFGTSGYSWNYREV